MMQKIEDSTNFIRKIIDDARTANPALSVVTRFPPEPNGYLHIGHAKSICLNFGLARDYAGRCHLRFDDTNPCNEEETFAHAIEEDVRWLGFDWGPHLYHTSDYFEQLYGFAVRLIQSGKAYVDSLDAETMRLYRGTLTTPGRDSPDRDRSIEANLSLFEQMRHGVFAEGQYTLRAKIDMSSGNINLRDPAMYRIRKVTHQRSGNAWCIYPMYDFSHALSDALEGITHSLCTLEFQDHRPLYDWFIEHCGLAGHGVQQRPRQIEFSRLNLNYTVTSKRKLKQLVEQGVVAGWDDPRMPTLSGLRRRGVPPEAIITFCAKVGISKQDSVIDMSVFEETIRDYLNVHAPRAMAVLQPLSVVIDNYPLDTIEFFSVAVHPQNPEYGQRSLPFGREIYIDADDFSETVDPQFFRLTPGGAVRLRNAYVIHCDRVVKDEQGRVVRLHCHYDASTGHGAKPADGRKIKGIIHWVSAHDAVDATIRRYDRLFNVSDPGNSENFLADINPHSLTVYHAKVESILASAEPEVSFQLVRIGYVVADRKEHQKKHQTEHQLTQPVSHAVFNEVVSLKSALGR